MCYRGKLLSPSLLYFQQSHCLLSEFVYVFQASREKVAHCLGCHFSSSEIRLGQSVRICVYLFVSLCRSPAHSYKLATNKLALPPSKSEEIIYFIDFLLYHQGLPS